MANPQKEDGHTPINHETLEALLRWNGPGRVKDFVLAVMRETWGWSERERRVPTTRFVELLGVTEGRVRQLREVACHCGLVERVNRTYRVQKDHEMWEAYQGNSPSTEARGRLKNKRALYDAEQEAPLRNKRTPYETIGASTKQEGPLRKTVVEGPTKQEEPLRNDRSLYETRGASIGKTVEGPLAKTSKKESKNDSPPFPPSNGDGNTAGEGALLSSAPNVERPPPTGPAETCMTLLARCCKDGLEADHAGIRHAVESQFAQMRDPAFVLERAEATFQWGIAAREAGRARPVDRIARYFTASCNKAWEQWSRERPDPWTRTNGPLPNDASQAMVYRAARMAWRNGEPIATTTYRAPSEAPPGEEAPRE